MKRSTLILGAVALAGVAVVAVKFLRPTPPPVAARPPAPGPNGVPGFDASTISNILASTNSILSGLGAYTKSSSSTFGGKSGSEPAPMNDVFALKGSSLPSDPNHLWS